VPALADGFSARPETAPGIGAALVPGAAVALVPSRDKPGSPDWLRSFGKTQLAAAYTESLWQARRIELLVWVDASSRASVLSGYAQAAAAAMETDPAASAESIAARFLSWLSETGLRWLVVLDDVTEAGVMDGIWPAGPAGQLLITTADPDAVPAETLSLPVGAFSPREALSYLMGRLSADPDQRLGSIDLVKDLGGEPTALAQASAVIASSTLSCRDYRDYFTRRREQMTEPPAGQPPAAAITWTFSFEQADQLSPDGSAQSLLALASLLDGHGIPAAVLTAPAACAYLPGSMAAGRLDTERAGTALLALERAGLLTANSAASPAMVRMSPVLQAALQDAMPEDLLGQAARAAASALLEAWPQDEPPGPLGASLRSCATALRQVAGDVLWAGGCHPVLLRAGESTNRARLTGPAVNYWRDLATTSDRLLGAGHPHTLIAGQHLADAYLAADRAPEAIPWFQWVLDSRIHALGPDHHDIIAARRNVGHALVAANQLTDAIGVLDRTASEYERLCGREHIETLGARDELAAAYLAVGQYTDAATLYKRTLADRERIQGAHHLQTIITRQCLADAYLADGRAKDAASAYKRVIADRERTLGRDHLDTIVARGNLGAACHAAGKMASAVQAYEQAREGCERVLGPDHRETLASRARLASAYYKVGRLGDAKVLLHDTADRCDRVLLSDDPVAREVHATLADLGE